MSIQPIRIIELDHRALIRRKAAKRSLCVAASKEGRVSIFDPVVDLIVSLTFDEGIRSLSLHPSKDLLAKNDEHSGGLSIVDFHGVKVLNVNPSSYESNGPEWGKLGFLDCMFDESGEYLWCVAASSTDKIDVQLRETQGLAIVHSTSIEDPFGGSHCSFYSVGHPSMMSLWIAAGQDGQQVFWLQRGQSGIECRREPALTNSTPPCFQDDGRECLVLNDDSRVCRFEFPGMRAIAGYKWSVGDHDVIAESLCYLDTWHALAASGNGRFYLIDFRTQCVSELAVQGHEPKPLKEYYPSLRYETELGSDIQDFERMGQYVVFVHRRNCGTGLADWKDNLLFCSVESILEESPGYCS